MLHKISDFCKKVESVKLLSDKLYNLKYNNPKTEARDVEIDNLIQDIQSQCLILSKDIMPYDK
jgi:hypothetical protein